MAKKPVNFRLDRDLLAELDALPGDRTAKFEDALRSYLKGNADVLARKVELLELELQHREELIAGLRAHVADLETQLGYLQRVLPPPGEKKKWWQFFRR